ncbi:hypothetical protein L9F63_008569, partial [Diploptera punctata]
NETCLRVTKRISRSFHSCLRGANSPEQDDPDDYENCFQFVERRKGVVRKLKIYHINAVYPPTADSEAREV